MKKEDSQIKAYMAEDTVFNGSLSFEGTVRIDGKFEGQVHTDDTLIVGDAGHIRAEIFAGTVKRVEEVQIPESEWPVIEPEVVTEEVDESGGNLLLKGLKSLFGNGEKKAAVKAGNQDAEVPEPLPIVNDNQNIEDSIPVPAELSEAN